MNENTTLKKLMKQHRLKRADVAEYTGRSLNAVASWLRSPATSGFRRMPANALELLEMKIARDGAA